MRTIQRTHHFGHFGHLGRRQGFTLVESLLALTFVAILFLAVAQTSQSASNAFDEGSVEHSLHTTAHRCIERMVSALELAERLTLNPDPELLAPVGVTSLQFRTPSGFAGGQVQWGPNTRLALELETGEVDDGLDNDGDDFVDEGRVVLTENPGQPGERSVVLCSQVAELLEGELVNNVDDNGNGLVDESGLALTALSDVVTLWLTCQRRDGAGRVLTKTVQTSVRLRN